ncbi:MAG: HAMP domain-containing sensor histidine kinase [Flavobacterium sp.]
MTLKRKIAINVSIAYSLLFGLASTFIYVSFSKFRKEEFKNRLEEKAFSTAKLLIEVKEIDKKILKLLDKNIIDKLYDEKILIFDGQYKLIYSSLDDSKITWTKNDLIRLNNEKSYFTDRKGRETLGAFFSFKQGDYYVLISAKDTYGYSKMEYLFYSLLITYFIGVFLVWVFIYFFIKKQLNPLDVFQQQITSISVNELNVHLEENNSNDEINLLTRAFNQMLTRLENAFTTQKEFTSNASHELYTPLTRISLQLENLINSEQHSEKTINYLKSINNDVHQLAELINSLLLLAKVNKEATGKKFQQVRIDEIIFDSNDLVKKMNPKFNLDFNIQIVEDIENPMEILGIKSLLKIAFTNLLKNACLYSPNNKAIVSVNQISNHQLIISLKNEGKVLTLEERKKIFEPFTRGKNSLQTKGSGLGLPIVKRILDYHNATISYQSIDETINLFEITFTI